MVVSHDTLKQCFSDDEGVFYVHVSGDGYYYELTVVSNHFEGMRPVARQRWVYEKLQQYITSGELHALTMHTWTEREWEKQCE